MVNWFFFSAAILYGWFCLGFVVWNAIRGDENMLKIIYQHYGATMCVPFAGFAALGLVLHLESRSEQPIEFTALGFQFKGASGPVVLWVVCFLALALCIKLLW